MLLNLFNENKIYRNTCTIISRGMWYSISRTNTVLSLNQSISFAYFTNTCLN